MVQLQISEDEEYTEPLLMPIGIVSSQITYFAILDFGADVNVLLAQLYQHLNTNKLLPSTTIFNSFTNKQIDCIGFLTTSIFTQDIEVIFTF